MARIDYFAIEEEMRDILQADSNLQGVTITIEHDILFGAEGTPWVNIKFVRSDSLDEQPLAAGTRDRESVQFGIECWEYSLANPEESAKLAFDLIGKVKTVLMANRTLNSKINFLRPRSLERITAAAEDTTMRGIMLVCEMEALSTT